MIHVQVAHAGSIPGRPEVDRLSIHADAPIPEDLDPEQTAATFSRDAALIAEALWTTLPGGTIDALLAMMMARRASSLRVALGRRHGVAESEAKGDGLTYLLWSAKHQMWWRPDERGYTANIDEAGRYTRADAVRIVAQSAFHGDLAKVTCMVAAPDNWTEPAS